MVICEICRSDAVDVVGANAFVTGEDRARTVESARVSLAPCELLRRVFVGELRLFQPLDDRRLRSQKLVRGNAATAHIGRNPRHICKKARDLVRRRFNLNSAFEDAVRRAFKAIAEDEGREWLQRHLNYCTAPLLFEPWVLDADTTVKPLYGHQEGAVLGYNPKKPGRPSHVYHTYTMAGLRLVLDVEVAAGNEHASKHAAPGLWALLDRIPRDCWPAFLRGDSGFGTEAAMREAEQRGLPYLFKLRLTANVKKLIKKTFSKDDWTAARPGLARKRPIRCGWRAGAASARRSSCAAG